MKITEKQIRRIIREALCELGGGDMNSIDDEIRQFNAELIRFDCEFDNEGNPTALRVRVPYDQFTGALDEYMSDTYGLNRYTVTAGSRGYKTVWYKKLQQKPINERIVQWDPKLKDLEYELKYKMREAFGGGKDNNPFDVKFDPNAGNYDPNYRGPKRLEVVYIADPNRAIRSAVENTIKGVMMRNGYEVDERVFGAGRSGYARIGFKTQDTQRPSFNLRYGNLAESVDRIVKESIDEVMNELDVYKQQDALEIETS